MKFIVSDRPANSRIAGLDLIRGFAIGLVLLRHAWPEVFGGAGIVGVVIFFALSGYLITGLIDRDIRKFGSLRYGRFYRNRAIRLLPALCFMLLGFSLVEGIFNILGHKNQIIVSVAAALTYTMNIPGIPHGSSALSHLWTLATEEQFYIFWPLVLTLGIRLKKLRLLVTGCALATLSICVLTLLIAWPEVERIYSLPTSWAISMIIGASARLWEPALMRLYPKRKRPQKILTVGALVFLIAMSLSPDPKGFAPAYLVGGPAVAISTVVLIGYLKNWRALPHAILRPVLWLGTVSYAAYLWNFPIAVWMGERPLAPVQAVGSIVLTLAAATLSWWFVEKPISRLKAAPDRAQETRSSNREIPDEIQTLQD